MRIREIEICGYRSLKQLRLELDGLTLLVGPNGCGKSNVYQSIQLLASAAHGQFARRIVEEGGIKSVLFAGKLSGNDEYKGRLAVAFDDLFYEMEFGRLPNSQRPVDNDDDTLADPVFKLFRYDPDIKKESVALLSEKKRISLFERSGRSVKARNIEGRVVDYPVKLMASESVLSELREPDKFPELSILRSLFADWRFYHDFRTDLHSPVRESHLATLTPILSHDAKDLASAIATIRLIGDAARFDHFVDRAFPESKISLAAVDGEVALQMSFPGLYRALDCRELSDGTLQYLCLLTALMTPRPPSFVVFNEPETSIHPGLFEALAELFAEASKRTQILLTTHARELSDYIKKKSNCRVYELEKINGETVIKSADTNLAATQDGDEESEAVRAFRARKSGRTEDLALED